MFMHLDVSIRFQSKHLTLTPLSTISSAHNARMTSLPATVIRVVSSANDNIDIFVMLTAGESVEGRNIITVVTKYPPGTV